MLLELSIQNFILIDKLNIEFQEGLNVLTGETGAGKSILIDAINVALGDKSNKEMIRKGMDKSVVQLTFLVERLEVEEKLTDLGIDLEENLLIISREIFGTGRSVVRINGRVTPLSILRLVSSYVIDIHGQHEHQSLLNGKNHIKLLDAYGKKTIKKRAVEETYKVVDDLVNELKGITVDSKDFERKMDLLNFQIDEIDAMNLDAIEDAKIDDAFELLKNSENISSSLEKSYNLISGESGVGTLKDQAEKLVQELEYPARYSADYKEIYKRAEEISFQFEDLATEIRVMKDDLTVNYEELEYVEGRLNAINDLKRKYGNSIEEIMAFNKDLKDELDQMANSKQRLDQLDDLIQHATADFYRVADQLSKDRKKVALSLQQLILTELVELNMSKARFKIEVMDKLKEDGSKVIQENGFDKVDFMISTNPGKDLGKLSKIASGGELSRIMLALKVITAEVDNIGTMIFDEIDTGISGQTASIVGKKMSYLSGSHQIICITHLPQIAAKGDAHYLIKKDHIEEDTITSIVRLNKEDRIREIARLISGDEISQISLANATEMLTV